MTKNYDIHTGDQLKQLFPYQFSHPHVTCEFYRGWMPIVAGLCMDLDILLGSFGKSDQHRKQFQWLQMKEKMGSARLYFTLAGQSVTVLDFHHPNGALSYLRLPKSPTDLFKQIHALVQAAQDETKTTCMVCGGLAQTKNYGGYLQTLCDAHSPDAIGQDMVRVLRQPRSPTGEAS
jgi:hypothetical protein